MKSQLLLKHGLSAGPWAVGVLLVGALAGGWVALDPLLTHEWLGVIRRAWFFDSVPYVLSALVGVATLLLGFLVWHLDRAWHNRSSVGVVMVLISMHLTGVGRGPFQPVMVVIVFVVGLWLLDRLLNPEAPWALSGFATLVALFLGCVLLSTLGRDPGEVFEGVLSTTPKLLLAMALADLLDNQVKVRRALSTFVWVAGVVALGGILQVTAYFVWQLEYTLVDPYFRYTDTSYGPFLRASGFARSAGQFAPPLAAASLIALYVCASPAGRGRRAALALLSILTAAAVSLSVARGSWVALAVGLGAVPFIARPSRTLHWIGLGGLVLGATLATGLLPWAMASIDRISEAGLVDRRLLLQAGFAALADHPWNGVGIYNFGPYSPTFERYPVHNSLLQVGSELGAPGLLIFVVLLLWVGLRLALAMRTVRDPVIKSRLGALLAGYVALLVVIQGEPMGYSQLVWIYLAVGEAAARVALSDTASVGERYGT